MMPRSAAVLAFVFGVFGLAGGWGGWGGWGPVLPGVAQAQVTFNVTIDSKAAPSPVSGRLVVSIIRNGADLDENAVPNDAPFWDDPQPMYGVDVRAVAPGTSMLIETSTPGLDSSPLALGALPAGKYRAQARLITTRLSSSWKDDAGNLFGPPVPFELVSAGVGPDVPPPPITVELKVDSITTTQPFNAVAGCELFEIRSELLSAFHKRDVMLRAGVVLPVKVEPGRQYAGVYEIPGFGGDHRSAPQRAIRRGSRRDQDQADLAASTFWIILDPESPNGHHLFADSANNGPVGRALVTELIPALEKKYPLAARPAARILRGHSSGGWSTVWLAINYPETFGAAWSSSPDPVDLRAFQLVDIYSADNFYTDPKTGKDFVSYRVGGVDRMTIRQENGGERVLGANQTSGQQWHSWEAAWGPCDSGVGGVGGVGGGGAGHPAALYDSVTGKINKGVLDHYRKYDIASLVRTDPKRYADPLRRNVRLVVGDTDDFSLNVAVGMLQESVAKLQPLEGPSAGYIRILPGLSHGSVLAHPSVRAFSKEMMDHLRASGLARAAGATPPTPTPTPTPTPVPATPAPR